MMLRKIICSVEGCGNAHDESGPNAGFPGWGHIEIPGMINPETGEEDTAHICPECRKIIIRVLKGEIK